MQKQLKVHAGLMTVALIYGANYSVAKFVMPEHIGPFGLILIRVSCAALIFLGLHYTLIHERIEKKDLARLVSCGFFGVTLNQLMFFKGLSLTSPIHASVLMLVTPILVLLAASIVLKEKVTVIRWMGIALGISGAFLLVLSSRKSEGQASLLGDVFVFINAASYAVYLVLVKPLLGKYHPLTVSKWTFIFGLPLVIPFGVSDIMLVDWSGLDVDIWLALLYIVLGVTVLAYLINSWTMKYVSPGMVGSYIYLQPVFAVSIALALGQDYLTLQKVLYILLIFAGVYFARSK